jgi:hypothetical protein
VSRQRIHQRLRDHGTVHPLGAACEVIDIAERTFANLHVIRRDESRKGAGSYWVVACKCGSPPFSVTSYSLRKGITTRCVTCARKGVRVRDGKLHDNGTVAERDAKLVASDPTTYQ